MTIVRHTERAQTRGRLSKIVNRRILSAEDGARSCELWDQILPVGGFIVSHFHEYEEVLTFLSGRVEIVLDGIRSIVGPDTTVLISPKRIHSVENIGAEPARILACHVAPAAEVKYPGAKPDLVEWNP
ncbi:MAG: cupin domain-containing protein [Myxococcales bacterium]|jgi:mannose-6-phosphate isomerase-like protein (cupin superfamily)